MLLWQQKQKEKSWLGFVVTDVHSIWKTVWVPQKNDWILSLRYNLQRSIMLFYEAEIFSFSKNINSIGPFPDPPIYSTIVYCMWRKNIDNGGVPVRGEREQGERAKQTRWTWLI